MVLACRDALITLGRDFKAFRIIGFLNWLKVAHLSAFNTPVNSVNILVSWDHHIANIADICVETKHL